MSFIKETTFELNSDNTEILDGRLDKTAAFHLPSGFNYDPNYLYLIVRGVSAGEYWGCNKNSDYFPEEELKANYKTFLAAHVFKNHENKQIENAIGDVIEATWNDSMKCVELLIRIDRKVAPTIVRGFEQGFMTDVSMGCRISHSVCSICGNKAKTKFEYCDHIKHQRGRIYDDGRKVYEINIAPKFHDISAVLTGAERSAKVMDMNLVKTSSEKTAADICIPRNIFDHTTQGMRKTASLHQQMGEYTPAPFYEPELKISTPFSKQAAISKYSEIQKEIEGDVIKSSVQKMRKDRLKRLEPHNAHGSCKILFGRYMSPSNCEEVGKSLQRVSDDSCTSDESVFCKFLEIADYCGIEFSPLELYNIHAALCGKKTIGTDSCPSFTEPSFLHKNEPKDFLSCLFPTARRISEEIPPQFDSTQILENPNAVLRIRVIKSAPVVRRFSLSPSAISSIKSIIHPMMPERSMCLNFLGPRLQKIAEENEQPNYQNLAHFSPIVFSAYPGLAKTAEEKELQAAGCAWARYEQERLENRVASDYYEKFASVTAGMDFFDDLEKTAIKLPKSDFMKSTMVMAPLAVAYSDFQRARIRNGKRVSSVNRMIAENPDKVALASIFLGPSALQGARGAKKKITASAPYQKLFHKSASDDIWMNSPQFSEVLEKHGYDKDQQLALKTAMLAVGAQREDLADDVLSDSKDLSRKDLQNFLHLAEETIKMEIEKNASIWPEMISGDSYSRDDAELGVYLLEEQILKRLH